MRWTEQVKLYTFFYRDLWILSSNSLESQEMSLRTGRPGDNWEISISSPTNMETLDQVQSSHLKTTQQLLNTFKALTNQSTPRTNFEFQKVKAKMSYVVTVMMLTRLSPGRTWSCPPGPQRRAAGRTSTATSAGSSTSRWTRTNNFNVKKSYILGSSNFECEQGWPWSWGESGEMYIFSSDFLFLLKVNEKERFISWINWAVAEVLHLLVFAVSFVALVVTWWWPLIPDSWHVS